VRRQSLSLSLFTPVYRHAALKPITSQIMLCRRRGVFHGRVRLPSHHFHAVPHPRTSRYDTFVINLASVMLGYVYGRTPGAALTQNAASSCGLARLFDNHLQDLA
jgi:hypothetical protein